MKKAGKTEAKRATPQLGGATGWLLGKLRGRLRAQPRLQLLERIPLAPRQSLALIEADGRRFLVATSAEGGPAFYPLEVEARREPEARPSQPRQPRVSW